MLVPVLTRSNPNSGNPGDVYICMGMQYLFEQAYGRPLNWLLLSKFGPQDMEDNLRYIQEAGFLIYAGTPQYNNYDDWCFWYDRELWTDYIEKYDLDMYALAGGGGIPGPSKTPAEFAEHCISSELTCKMLKHREGLSKLITVRDPCASALLSRLEIKHRHLPCTAAWAAPYLGIQKKSNEYVALVLPNAGMVGKKLMGGASSAKEGATRQFELFNDIADYLALRGKKPVFVCHWKPEYDFFSKHMPKHKIFFTNSVNDLLKFYARCELVVSARLHAALPAYGIPGTKVAGIKIDTRGTAMDKFPSLPTITIDKLYQNWRPFINRALGLQPSNQKWFERQTKRYVNIIRREGPKIV
jgi:hypothetical protein